MFVVVILSRHRRRLVDWLHAPLILPYAAFQVYWLEISLLLFQFTIVTIWSNKSPLTINLVFGDPCYLADDP